MSFLLVLEKDEPLPVYDIGRDVAKAVRRPLADVTRELLHCRGILDLDLGEAEAERLAGLLEGRGIPSRVVPGELLPPLPPPQALRDADPTEEGLVIQSVAGEAPPLLPWERLRLAAAGEVTFREAPPPSAAGDAADPAIPYQVGMFLGWGMSGALAAERRRAVAESRRALRSQPKTRTVHALDLVTSKGKNRFRIVAGRFRYDYLGERIAPASRQNFVALLGDIARLSPDTYVTGSTLSYLEKGDARHRRFRDPEQFEGYVRWTFAWPDVFWGGPD